MPTEASPNAYIGTPVESQLMFLPSMLGLTRGLLAPSATDQACVAGYDRGDAPFRHIACHDPRRFAIVGIPCTVAATTGRLTVPATTSPIRVFRYGITETDSDANFSQFGPRTAADTNLEAGGYLIPPGFEGLVCGIGFAPIGVAPLSPNAVVGWVDPIESFSDYESTWRKIFAGVSAGFEYWETSTKATRIVGNLERWPVGDSMDHALLSTNGARGAFARLNPLQFHIPTLGPAERRGDERSDRLTVLLNVERVIEVANPGAVDLASGDYLLLVRVELAVGMMLDPARKPDVEQDRALTAQEARIARLEAKLAERG